MSVETAAELRAMFDPAEFGIVFSVNGAGSIAGMYDGPYTAALALGPAGIGVASEEPTITCPEVDYPGAVAGDQLVVTQTNEHQAFLAGAAFAVEQVEPSGDGLVLLRLSEVAS